VYVTNQHPDGEHVDKVFPGTTPTTTVVAHAMQLDKLIKGQRQSQGFKVHARRVTTEEVWTS
jgi:predicted SpoU family rRNA methylase